jgi:hypothetical protein
MDTTLITDTLFVNDLGYESQIEAIATAIGSLFAMVATIVAFLAYRRDRTSQNNKIEELTKFTTALKEQTEFDRNVYKESIQPHFRVLAGGGLTQDMKTYTIKFKNDGEGYAFISKIEIEQNNYGLLVDRSIGITKRIEVNSELHLEVFNNERATPWREVNLTINLEFTDKTKQNKYSQKINFKPTEPLTIEEVELIEGKKEEIAN